MPRVDTGFDFQLRTAIILPVVGGGAPHMTLADVRPGERVRVLGRAHREGAMDTLAAVGIHVGDEVLVVRAAAFQGPLLIEVPSSGVRVALGRGMAAGVEVERAHAAA